jgi:hypothetical protein
MKHAVAVLHLAEWRSTYSSLAACTYLRELPPVSQAGLAIRSLVKTKACCEMRARQKHRYHGGRHLAAVIGGGQCWTVLALLLLATSRGQQRLIRQ